RLLPQGGTASARSGDELESPPFAAGGQVTEVFPGFRDRTIQPGRSAPGPEVAKARRAFRPVRKSPPQGGSKRAGVRRAHPALDEIRADHRLFAVKQHVGAVRQEVMGRDAVGAVPEEKARR